MLMWSVKQLKCESEACLTKTFEDRVLCDVLYLALQLRQLFGQLCLCGLRKLMVQTALILLLHTFFVLHLQERRVEVMLRLSSRCHSNL